ncbi:MAG: hypothetical protein JXA18_12760 [Chitinispirillaceae bacterium]|nr:hypothetical protein [Chitinispirillaceae bacterium]
MNSNSPMMRRVKRGGAFRYFHSLPRKGRIRFVLVLLLCALFIRFGPPVVRKLELPTPASARENDSTTADEVPPVKKKSRSTRVPPDSVAQLLFDNPVCLSYNRITAFFEEESLMVYTSTDTALQHYLMKLVDRYCPLYAAMVAIHPASGRILSLVSYRNDSMPDQGGHLCLRAVFPAASIFKTVTAAAAIEYADFTAGCTVEHRGRTSTLYRSQIKQELDGAIDLTFSQAYARSINSVFARIGMYHLGSPVLLDVGAAFGFNTRLPGELTCDISRVFAPEIEYQLAELASGFNQKTTLSPLHGALIASCIAEDGTMPVPSLLDSIVRNHDGTVRYVAEKRIWRRPIGSSTARELQSMMKAVVTYGTAAKEFRGIRKSRRFGEFVYGGKTGSIDKDGIGRVDWFVGYAVHPKRVDERIAVCALAVHGAYWTVHSSYLAAEAMRFYLQSVQEQKKIELADAPPPAAPAALDSAGQSAPQSQ